MSTESKQEPKLGVNTPKALAAMMRQAQSDPLFREQLSTKRCIPFGSLASALEAYDNLQSSHDELVRALTHLADVCDPLRDPFRAERADAVLKARTALSRARGEQEKQG